MTVARDIVNTPAMQLLKRSCDDLVGAAGGQARAAEFSGKSQQRLSDYGRPNNAEFMPVNVVRQLEAVTHGLPGHPHVTRILASAAGYLLVPKPEGHGATTGDIHAAIARYVQEHGEAMARAIGALADHALTPDEAPAVMHELDEAIEAAVMLRSLLGQVAAGDG